VTCAHVVAEALGDPAIAISTEAPAAPIPLDLPLLAVPFRTTARVVCWQPARDDGTKVPEDIAVLELEEAAPSDAEPAALLALPAADYTALPVHCFGFPARIDEGIRRFGTCRGENALGRIQLDIERGLVEGGFSGTAAWDSERGGAVGLVVAVRTEEQSAQLIPVRTLFTACPALDRDWRPRNPYKGLAAFESADRADFFGRAETIPRLAERVTRERLTTLIGPSGSGKSSLIGAGLIPRVLEQGGWRVLRIRPGSEPFDALAGALLAPTLTLSQRVEERRRLSVLLRDPPAADGCGGVERVLEEWVADPAQPRVLLIVDQFEELFTNAEARDPESARNFAAALVRLVVPRDQARSMPVHLLIALRADFMGRAMEGPTASFVAPEHQFQIGPLAGNDLRAALEGPAAAQGVRFAPGLAERMLDDLEDQPGRLPLLQFALTALWDQQQARIIDAAALERMGGVRRALANYADSVIDALAETDRGRARRILVQLVRPPEHADEAATRQVTSLRRIAEEDLDLLPRLAESRLVVTSSGPDDTPLAEIAHEALIREWERFATWVAEDRAFRLLQEGLRSRLADWDAHRRAPGFLLAGPALAEAEARLAAAPEGLSRDDRDYIGASRTAARHKRRRQRATITATMLGLALVAGVAVFQWQQASTAARDAREARDSAEDLISFMTFDLREKLKPIGKLEIMRDTQQRILDYYARLRMPDDDPILLRRYAVNLSNAGDLSMALGDLPDAESLYAKASRISERLARAAPNDPDWQSDLAISLEKRGDLKTAQGNLAEARAAYEESRAICEGLVAADPSNTDRQHAHAVSLIKLGRVHAAQGDFAAAQQHNEHALSIGEDLTAIDPNNASLLTDLIGSLDGLGGIQVAEGNLAEALNTFEQSRGIAERLVEADPSNLGWQRNFALSLERLGEVRIAQTNPDGARAAYEKSLEIRKRLAEADPSNAEWLHELAATLHKIGYILLDQSDLAGAEAAYRESRAIAERLVASDPSNAAWQRDLAGSVQGLGDIHRVRGDLAAAQAAYEESVAILERLVAADPSNSGVQFVLAMLSRQLGDILGSREDLAESRAAYEKSIAINERLANDYPGNPFWQRELAASVQELGRMHSVQGDLKAARAAYEKSVAISKGLVAGYPGNQSFQRKLSVMLEEFGNVLYDLRDFGGALGALEESRSILERLIIDDPGNAELKADLAFSFQYLSREGLAEVDVARNYLHRALAILDELDKAGLLDGAKRSLRDFIRTELAMMGEGSQ
jgi:tetratricopeptide (TPR) repeat protein